MNVFRPDDLSTTAASRKLAAEVFGGPEWEKEGHKVYGTDPVKDGVASYAIGNCHVGPFRMVRSEFELTHCALWADRHRMAGERNRIVFTTRAAC